jgi:hypothetical protein
MGLEERNADPYHTNWLADEADQEPFKETDAYLCYFVLPEHSFIDLLVSRRLACSPSTILHEPSSPLIGAVGARRNYGRGRR